VVAVVPEHPAALNGADDERQPPSRGYDRVQSGCAAAELFGARPIGLRDNRRQGERAHAGSGYPVSRPVVAVGHAVRLRASRRPGKGGWGTAQVAWRSIPSVELPRVAR